jgi:ribosomal protein S18 acetylase RimI-like enzyme
VLSVRPGRPADRDQVVALLGGSWGDTRVAAHGVLYDAAALPSFLAFQDGELVGLLTYHLDDEGLEVVTLDAVRPREGVGTALLTAVANLAYDMGCARVWLITTNDNLDALRFYQRRGMQIVDVALDAVEASRALKPTIPTVGAYWIPIRDELTLELWVS